MASLTTGDGRTVYLMVMPAFLMTSIHLVSSIFR